MFYQRGTHPSTIHQLCFPGRLPSAARRCVAALAAALAAAAALSSGCHGLCAGADVDAWGALAIGRAVERLETAGWVEQTRLRGVGKPKVERRGGWVALG